MTRISAWNLKERSQAHLVRHLERLPVGTSYPEIAGRVAEVAGGVRERTGSRVELFVDATGLGDPVVGLLGKARDIRRTWAVYFTHGDRRTEDSKDGRREVTLGKGYLVSRLQLLLQCRRLHLPRTPDADVLAEELREYDIRVEADANERYGAFRVGTQDDFVTALGMAVQKERRRSVYPGQGE